MRDKLLPLLRRKAVRTISGVTVVAVMTKPWPCPKENPCAYCPGGPPYGVPQSYTGHEPAAMRGIQSWLKTVSPSTRVGYRTALKEFCEFSGKNPRQLILERDAELKNPEPDSRTGIRDLVLDFREYLEKEEYAPKTINAWDGAIRGFFTAGLGKAGMINVKNYRNAQVSTKKDLVPTLDELKRMLDVCNLEEKFRKRKIRHGQDYRDILPIARAFRA